MWDTHQTRTWDLDIRQPRSPRHFRFERSQSEKNKTPPRRDALRFAAGGGRPERDGDEDGDLQRQRPQAADLPVRLAPQVARFLRCRHRLLPGDEAEEAGAHGGRGDGGGVRVLLLVYAHVG